MACKSQAHTSIITLSVAFLAVLVLLQSAVKVVRSMPAVVTHSMPEERRDAIRSLAFMAKCRGPDIVAYVSNGLRFRGSDMTSFIMDFCRWGSVGDTKLGNLSALHAFLTNGCRCTTHDMDVDVTHTICIPFM